MSKIHTSGFNVKSSSYGEEHDFEREGDDEWSRADTSTSHSIEGIELCLSNPDCVGAFLAYPGDEVHLVSVVYSTGDSFGHDQGSGLEHIAVFFTKEKADRCRDQIEAYNNLQGQVSSSYADKNTLEKTLKAITLLPHDLKKINKKSDTNKQSTWDIRSITNRLVFLNEADEPEEAYAPWYGYFEHLDYIEVSTFKVGPPVQIAHTLSRFKEPKKADQNPGTAPEPLSVPQKTEKTPRAKHGK